MRDLLNIDLDGYKEVQMRRRLDSFIARSQAQGVAAYCKMLEDDQEQRQKIRDFLTIHVSEFWRDPEQYGILQNIILPDMLLSRPRLNIWSAGCSHGAEPYSMAIILNELSPHNHRILATDVDEVILSKAKAGGPYLQSDFRNVPNKFILKYFTQSKEGLRVVEQIRQKVEFRQHNLLGDPFDNGFDLIVCRNVVIYFTDDAKRILYQRFYNALKNDGVLFLGASETMLGILDIGFKRLYPSFYRKPATGLMTQSRATRTSIATAKVS
jgi:chemotaxis protein methyltransferase CheR